MGYIPKNTTSEYIFPNKVVEYTRYEQQYQYEVHLPGGSLDGLVWFSVEVCANESNGCLLHIASDYREHQSRYHPTDCRCELRVLPGGWLGPPVFFFVFFSYMCSCITNPGRAVRLCYASYVINVCISRSLKSCINHSISRTHS